jgi:DNA-binding transcriptional ArsR family regulator
LPKSDIPFGSEFGPNQVDLVTVLRLAQAHAGDGGAFTAAIATQYGWPLDTAKNTRLGLHSYRLMHNDIPTDVAKRLLDLADDPKAMYEEFVRHILLNLHGLEVVTAIDDMLKVGERVTLTSLSAYLKPLGLYVPATGTHLSKLRGWLLKAGVFTSERDFSSINMLRVRELIGVSDDSEIDALAEMPEDQRAFLKALANLPMPTIPDEAPLQASEVVDYASTLYGATFNEKGIVRATLVPLQEAGFITIDKPPKATGDEAGTRRQISGKSTLIYRTEKFANEYLAPLIDTLTGTRLAVRQLMRKPLADRVHDQEADYA